MSLIRFSGPKCTKVYLGYFKQIIQIALLMFAQGRNYEQKAKSGWKYNQRLGQYQKIKFLTLNLDFKFKQIISFNRNKNLHVIQGQLVYNNGAIVPLSVSHQNLLDRTLNGQFNQSKQKIVFSIDSSKESLVYTGKVVGLPEQLTDLWVKECEKEVAANKRKLIHLLAVVGFQIDSQNELMKKIIFQKRSLQLKIEELIGKKNEQKVSRLFQQGMVNENEESSVIYFGNGTDINIEVDDQKGSQEQKKVEGGYFSIQTESYKITRKNQPSQKVTLCRKTLRSKKKVQEDVRKMNQRKMKKEIEIVQSIKNKKYLIKYYCKKDLDSLQEILMEKYDYSLQEYINYFADSLEIQHKIIIAQQIVEAVILLHASGVVHRDIKPSNFLISDHCSNRNFYKLKIIDFAQSYSDVTKSYEGDYACSHPYSPLECSEFRSNGSSRSQQGIKNKEIDYWSVGVIVYQVFFRKLPLSFSRVFHLDIAANWKSELLLTVNQRQKYGLAVVQDIITILCIKMLKIEQEKRMKLEIAMQILILLENYVKNIMKIVEEAK